MIDCGHVAEGYPAYEDTKAALH